MRKCRAPRSAQDRNYTAIKDECNDADHHALKKYLHGNIGERHLDESGSSQPEIKRCIDYQRPGGDECCCMERVEFRPPHDEGEAGR